MVFMKLVKQEDYLVIIQNEKENFLLIGEGRRLNILKVKNTDKW